MARKGRTQEAAQGSNAGQSGGDQHPAAAQQPQHPVRPQQQPAGGYQGGGRGGPQRGGYAGQGSAPRSPATQMHPQQGGRGWVPQHGQGSNPRAVGVGTGVVQRPPAQQMQQPGGGRGLAPQRGGYAAGRGGGPGGRMPPQQYVEAPRGGPSPPQRPDGGYGAGRGAPVAGGPSRQGPSLPQAGVVPQSSPFGRPGMVEAGSSSGPQPSVPDVVEQTQQLSLVEEGVPSSEMQPASSKAVRFPPRPGKGTKGRRCLVKANHFFVELPDKDLHHYDITITPEVPSRGVNRKIISKLVELYKDSHLGNRLPAYDGRKSLYTAGALPFESKDFEIELVNDAGGYRRERKFKVTIKFAAKADLHHLGRFLQGRQPDAPQEVLQVLDVVLRQLPTSKYTPFGRSFFNPDFGRAPLGGGIECWAGYYQSIRPTQMGLSLNIDMSATAFFEPIDVLDFLHQNLPREALAGRLSPATISRMRKELRGVRVETTHTTPHRKYRVAGLTTDAIADLTFPIDGVMKPVVQYFREKYGVVIQRTQWPCLNAGTVQKPVFLPMEVCKIVQGQRYTKKLVDQQTTALLRFTCKKPEERERRINKAVRDNAYHNDEYAKEFGIKIGEQSTTVEARVLPPPTLKYHDSGRERECRPQVGQWNMMNKRMYQGGTVNNWICVNFARNVPGQLAYKFCKDLASMCVTSGLTFNPEPALPIFSGRPDNVTQSLKNVYKDVKQNLQGQELDLLIAILPDGNSCYGDLKRILETELGIVSQCCLAKNVFKSSQQYLANVALKINAKAGGSNTVLLDAHTRSIPNVSSEFTIIFGADVTHPQPGEDSSPSIAAVVASQDRNMSRYAARVRAQPHRQEIIYGLAEMVRDLLRSYYASVRARPMRIIFYRDGVSEGQFSQVLAHELHAIRMACNSLENGYRPKITFVVVQKRHHTRLFPNNHNDRGSVDRSGNVLAGTVVDTKICHPTEFDFFLCSHAGIQGTSRPAHYHVLYDDSNFRADDLQSFTHDLCYTFARCTRSVSIVPAAYYAHLAAFRARFYMRRDGTTTDGGTDARGGAQRPDASRVQAAVEPLPELTEKMKRAMFFC